MRRALKWIGWTLAVLVGLPLLLLAGVLGGANTDPGRRLIERETASLTGGMVRLSGLSGRFPDALRVARLEVADAAGAYVTVQDVALDWSPTRLLAREALIDRLAAARVTLVRLPQSSDTSSSGSSFDLPVRVVLRRLDVARIDVAEAVAGTAVALSATGAATLESFSAGQGQIVLQQLDGGGRYTLDGTLDAQTLRAAIGLNEPAHGVLAGIAGLPDLGAIAVDATLDGPLAAIATRLTVSAGELRARAGGTLDLTHQAVDLAVTAQAPAMTPRSDVSWQSVAVDARVHGPFTAPDATGTVRIADLKAAGAAIAELSADVAGNAGTVTLHAKADRLHLPDPQPDLLAEAPLLLDATARLDTPERPVSFALRHSKLTIEGTARTAGPLQARVTITVPELAPFASAGGVPLQGRTEVTLTAAPHGDDTAMTLQGTLGLTAGTPPLPALLGDATKIDVAAILHGQDVTLQHLQVNGKAIEVTAAGSFVDQTAALDWSVRLGDLAALQPTLGGTLEAKGHAAGKPDNLTVTADLTGDIAAQGYRSGQVTAHVEASGLPAAPQARLTAQGTLLDSPLALSLAASRLDGTTTVTIDRATWKTARAQGNLSLAPDATLPVGRLSFAMTRLADLAPLIGQAIGGSVDATLDADTKAMKLAVTGQGLGVPGAAAVSRLALNATVTEPAGRQTLDASLALDGVNAGGFGGAGRLTARGPIDALAVTVASTSPNLMGAPARLDAAGTVNANDRTLALGSLQAAWKQQTLRLLAPARIGFAQDITIDRLRLGLRQAEIAVSGRSGATLDLTASVKNLPADIAAVVAPDYAADGTLSADAHITGTAARPTGTVRVTATGLRLRRGPGRALPPANIAANATLAGTNARIDTRATAGASKLSLAGIAPLAASGALDLRGSGAIDLALLDPLLAADGRRVRGQLSFDAAIAGTTTAPRISGTAQLVNGEVQDTPLGAHLTAVTALVEATGDTIRLTRFSAKAGPGTVGGSGTIGLAAPMPVDLHLTAQNARPLTSDLLTALIDADLTLRGQVQGTLAAGGRLHIRRADIRVPETLPSSVAVLQVRNAGTPPLVQPPPKPLDLALDLTIEAPEQVFIRGRGLDAELGGTMHIRGTAANPLPDGGLTLRRGTFSLAGQTLNFTEGGIGFTGAGLTDPAIKLVAQTVTATMTATLTVSGSARDPKIALSSTPDMPQDEILAQLLFNSSTGKLSPFQIAEIGAALASLSGAGGGFSDPLAGIRNGLGLDRLSVGSGANGAAMLEAGSYLARGVYVGAKQSASGSGTQATVQIDLAKGLKAEATAGAGTTSATGATGSADAASVGLTYQFEY